MDESMKYKPKPIDLSTWQPRDPERWIIEMPPEPFQGAWQGVLRSTRDGSLWGVRWEEDGAAEPFENSSGSDLIPPIEYVYVKEFAGGTIGFDSFPEGPIACSPKMATHRYQKGDLSTMEPWPTRFENCMSIDCRGDSDAE